MSSRVRLGAWVAAGVLGGGLVAGVAVSQLGIASAASPSPSPSASGDARHGHDGTMPGMGHRFLDRHGPGHGFGGGFGLGPGIGALHGDVLHSEATVKTPDGTRVVGSQSGKITDVGGSTLTVRSSDGFTCTYTVDKDTRIGLNGTDGALTSLESGDTVHVMGTKTGSTWHARGVLDGMPPMPPGVPDRPMGDDA